MWHPTCTQVNQGDYQLLVVGSWITNLNPNPFFGHKICFKYPNEKCEPILTSKFQKLCNGIIFFNPMSFDPCNRPLKIQKSIGTPIPEVGAHLGVCGFIPSHSLTFLGTWNVTPGFHFWLAPLQALTLGVRPRLGLWQLLYFPNQPTNLTTYLPTYLSKYLT